MFSIYILKSVKLNRYYIGSTNNVNRRILEHNNVKFEDAFTKNGVPWVLVLSIDNLNSKQAYQIEKHFKKMKSALYIENAIRFPNIIQALVLKYR